MRFADARESHVGATSNTQAHTAARRSQQTARSGPAPRECSAANSESAGAARSSADESGHASRDNADPTDGSARSSDKPNHPGAGCNGATNTIAG